MGLELSTEIRQLMQAKKTNIFQLNLHELIAQKRNG